MPRYELMYLLAGNIADGEIESHAQNLLNTVSGFGASDIEEDALGKKKLAYPIQNTKNGYYGVLRFNLAGQNLSVLDAKLRTLKNLVIRYLIINIDDYLKRLAKDKKIQSGMKRTPQGSALQPESGFVPVDAALESVVKTEDGAVVSQSDEIKGGNDNLDLKIEAALSDSGDAL